MHKIAVACAALGLATLSSFDGHRAFAQERLPWQTPRSAQSHDPYAPQSDNQARTRGDDRGRAGAYPRRPRQPPPRYRAPERRYVAPAETYRPGPNVPAPRSEGEYRRRYDDRSYDRGYDRRRDDREYDDRRSYSQSEIVAAGHRLFGRLSTSLAQAIAYTFRRQGRPTGYILGEDAGGALIAGLRYGEGYLHTKYGDRRKVFWQGPTLGYDFGGEGSRTMVLVYNLSNPASIFRRFGGVQGSAYVVGGVSVQLLKHQALTLAPIRTGVGLRLGANVGYLKFTRRPTWNPF